MLTLRRAAVTLLLLAPLACGDDKSLTTEDPSAGPTSADSSGGSTSSGSDGGATSSASAPTTTQDDSDASTGTSGAEGTSAAQTETGGTSTTGGQAGGCEGDAPRVRIATNMGDMVVELDAVNAPITVANFIHYVEAEFYAGTIFHRVIAGFVLQGGGYTVDMTLKPTDPPIPLETSPALTHVDGAIAMARTDDPDSATSQFYICDGPQAFLDGNYAVFGVLVEGFDVRDAIAAVPTENDQPIEDVIIHEASCE